MPHSRSILSVIGPHSGCGKTTFVAHLLRHIAGLGTLKISPAHDQPETSTREDALIGKNFYLEDTARLHRAGKDTAMYFEAGAVHVERMRHRAGGLAAGLDAAMKRFPPGVPVVVESSSAVKLLTRVAVVLVLRPPPREIKPSTRDLLPSVTDLLINASDYEDTATAEARRLEREFPSLRPKHTWFADLLCEPLPEALLTRLRCLLLPARR